MRPKTTSIRIYTMDHQHLLKELSKRLKAWEKSKNGEKPWIADIIKEMVSK